MIHICDRTMHISINEVIYRVCSYSIQRVFSRTNSSLFSSLRVECSNRTFTDKHDDPIPCIFITSVFVIRYNRHMYFYVPQYLSLITFGFLKLFDSMFEMFGRNCTFQFVSKRRVQRIQLIQPLSVHVEIYINILC